MKYLMLNYKSRYSMYLKIVMQMLTHVISTKADNITINFSVLS